MLACAYKRPECCIGVILGTGTNASYVESMSLCDLYEGKRPRTKRSVVINTEWGAFGNTGSLDIIRTRYRIVQGSTTTMTHRGSHFDWQLDFSFSLFDEWPP